MLRFAPRYPERILELIEQLDDEALPLAEVARLVGAAAELEGLIRPSPVHVRRLVSELRRIRADEREIRQAAWDALTRPLPYAPGNPYDVEEAARAARERVERRARRRET